MTFIYKQKIILHSYGEIYDILNFSLINKCGKCISARVCVFKVSKFF